MCFAFNFGAINWLAVLVATVAAFVLGWIYYSPTLLGNLYMKESKMSEERMKQMNPMIPMIMSFIVTFLSALALEIFFKTLGFTGVVAGMVLGLVVGLFFVGINLLSDYMFSGNSPKLMLIQVLYRVLMFVTIGVVIGLWP